VTEQARSFAVSTRRCPSHAIRKAKSVRMLHFRQVDISQNLDETVQVGGCENLDCYANNCCWGPAD